MVAGSDGLSLRQVWDHHVNVAQHLLESSSGRLLSHASARHASGLCYSAGTWCRSGTRNRLELKLTPISNTVCSRQYRYAHTCRRPARQLSRRVEWPVQAPCSSKKLKRAAVMRSASVASCPHHRTSEQGAWAQAQGMSGIQRHAAWHARAVLCMAVHAIRAPASPLIRRRCPF